MTISQASAEESSSEVKRRVEIHVRQGFHSVIGSRAPKMSVPVLTKFIEGTTFGPILQIPASRYGRWELYLMPEKEDDECITSVAQAIERDLAMREGDYWTIPLQRFAKGFIRFRDLQVHFHLL